MKSQQTGVSLIHIMLGIVVVTIISLFAYNLINRPPNKHIGKGEPWQSAMSQGSHTAPNVFVDYTDYFCSFCAQVEAATNTADFQQYIKSGKLRYEHRIVAVLKDIVAPKQHFARPTSINIGNTRTTLCPASKLTTLTKVLASKALPCPKKFRFSPSAILKHRPKLLGSTSRPSATA